MLFPLWLVLFVAWGVDAASAGWLPAGVEAVAALLMGAVELVLGGEVSGGVMAGVQLALVALAASVVACALVEVLRAVLVSGCRWWLTRRWRRLAVPKGADFSDVVVVPALSRRKVVVYQRPDGGRLLKLGVIEVHGMPAAGVSEWDIDAPSGYLVRVGAWGADVPFARQVQWIVATRDDGVSSLVARWWSVHSRQIDQAREHEQRRNQQKATKSSQRRARHARHHRLVES